MPRAQVGALSLSLLLLPLLAAAQVPPTSPAAVGTIPAAKVPDGTTSTLGVRVGMNLMKMRDDKWAPRDDQVFTDFLIAITADRLGLDIAIPMRVQIDGSRIVLGPIFLGGGLVLKPRPTGARGVAVALRIGSDLRLDDVTTERFDTELGVAVDVMLAYGIRVAAYAGLGASARYGLRDPAFQSASAGAGVDVPLGDHLHLLGGLSGRVDAYGGPSVHADAWVGVRLRIGHLFVTPTVAVPFEEPGLRFDLTLHIGHGEGLLPPSERPEAPAPPHGCVETSCTPPQWKAVNRLHAEHIEALRQQLVALAALIELRFHVHAPAPDERAIVRLTIPNDLSIANDGDRKRELSIRFLLAAFSRGGVAIHREIAAALLDRTAWSVKIERDIDEPVVDYFTYESDMRTLAAAYAGYLEDNAKRLATIAGELRKAWTGTDEILFDIARGHVNGVIGVLNGALDLPLAGYNLVQFLRDEPGFHIGRIPHLEYKSDWGRKNGGAMELGVAIGTMTGPWSAIFGGLGNTVAPALMRLGEALSLLTWRGLPVGKIIASVLATWMKGSVVAVKMHAATDAVEIIRALITGKVRQPDGTYREMSADDFEQLVFAFIQDAAVAKALVEGERGIGEEPPAKREQQRAEGGRFTIRNAHLAGKVHPRTGVPFDAQGYPDFRAAGVVEAEVKIRQTGKRKGDEAAANRAAGFKETPDGMTWHHHQDGATMQLVPTPIHDATGHTGGFRRRSP